MTDDPFIEKVVWAGLCNKPTFYNTYELTCKVIEENIPGDLVECGVFAGAQPAIMAHVCQFTGSGKRVHLFDSFEGIPMAGVNDEYFEACIGKPPEGKRGALETTGVSACSLEQVQRNMFEWGIDSKRLRYHKGWFQVTVLNAVGFSIQHSENVRLVKTPDIEKIALLRLDGDLYESTKVCLEYLYPLLSSGGFCIADDYALPGCKQAIDEYLAGMTVQMLAVEGGGGVVYWRKP